MVVEPLSIAHDRKSFDCGETDQNEFLKHRARKHAKIGYSQTYVAVEPGKPRILGFVTLSMGSVEFEEVDETHRACLPRYPMPVVRLGQLGTDIEFQGRGIGPYLIKFGCEKAIEMAQYVGCYAVVIDADKESGYDWYLRQGFVPLKKESLSVFLPIETLKKAFKKANQA